MNWPIRAGASVVTGYLGAAFVGTVLGNNDDLEGDADTAVKLGAGVALVAAGVEIVRGAV